MHCMTVAIAGERRGVGIVRQTASLFRAQALADKDLARGAAQCEMPFERFAFLAAGQRSLHQEVAARIALVA